MDNLNEIVGHNLHKLRKSRGLSLDKVAALTAVSKSMLGQIERAESNPTISTIWKIANGLKVSFTSLIKQEKPEVYLVHKNNIAPLTEDNDKYRVYPIFPYEEDRHFEIYQVEMDPGAKFIGPSHGKGSREYITVFAGQISIETNGKIYTVDNGSSISFNTDQDHVYENKSNNLTVVSMVIYYELFDG